jgi:hypothetical protein
MDFAFHGNKTGNRLQSFRDHGLIMAGPRRRRDNPGVLVRELLLGGGGRSMASGELGRAG